MGRGPRVRKVIVIGLDGLEPTLVSPLIASGALPNLGRLAGRGGAATVATTSPAQTPVAWSTFATGTNPGGHGVFDFIRRDPRTCLPDLGLNRYEQKSAWLPPRAVNLRRGTPVWDLLAEKGLGSTVLRCPCSYPASLSRGRMLSGMGVPDLRGGLGTPTFFSTEPTTAGESENVGRLEPAPDGGFTTVLPGPRHPRDRSTLGVELSMRPDPVGGTLSLRAAGSADALTLRPGEWSDWLRVKFKAGVLQAVRGLVRFHLVRLGPRVELYASPVNFDPEMPPFPISAPAGFAHELAEAIGTYHTTGMVEDHTGLNNERFGEEAFLDQCEDAWAEREAMLLHELGRFDEGMFYCLFDTPDRAQHMLWRFREPDHPANRGQAPRPDLAAEIEQQYRRADEMVGHALDAADDQTLVVALSDHGFGSFRRGFHLNRWLHDQGLLALADGTDPGHDAPPFPHNVDWSRTRAYALGLGGIYLNLEGREGQGTVKAAEAEGLVREIQRGLTGLVDAERATVAVREVKTRADLYQGPYADESPDLVAHLASGYRISWESSLGGLGEGWFEDNRKKWGGDHIIDPALVPGVLFMNRPFRGDGARLLDLAPTILDALGLDPGPAMEGSSLLS